MGALLILFAVQLIAINYALIDCPCECMFGCYINYDELETGIHCEVRDGICDGGLLASGARNLTVSNFNFIIVIYSYCFLDSDKLWPFHIPGMWESMYPLDPN